MDDQNDIELQQLVEQNDSILKGRQLIAKFKKGGRIDKDRTYDSASIDWETQQAIQRILLIGIESTGPDAGVVRIDSSLIGKGFKICAPWQGPLDGLEYNEATGKYKIKGTVEEWKRMSFERSIPIRVSDFIEQPSGTIIVTLESS